MSGLTVFKTIKLMDQVDVQYGHGLMATGKVVAYQDGMLVIDVNGPVHQYVLVESIVGYQVWSS